MTIEIIARAVAGKLISTALEKPIEGVLQRCSDFRRRRFLTALAEALADEREEEPNTTVDRMLTKIQRPPNEETFFDAYRRSVLALSREQGPRLIGLLAAQIIRDDRAASVEDEQILMAAEAFSDRDFGDMLSFNKQRKLDEWHRSTDGYANLPFGGDSVLIGSGTGGQLPGLVELGAELGLWARKLESIGMVFSDLVHEAKYRGRTWEVEPGLSVERVVRFSPACLRFLQSAKRL